jgi:hypothetical protein
MGNIKIADYANEFIEYQRLNNIAQQAEHMAKDLRNWKKIKSKPPLPGMITFIDLITPEILKEVAYPVSDILEAVSKAFYMQAKGLVVGEKNVQSEESPARTESSRD